jgi:hypothetical protein
MDRLMKRHIVDIEYDQLALGANCKMFKNGATYQGIITSVWGREVVYSMSEPPRLIRPYSATFVFANEESVTLDDIEDK